MGNFIDMTGKRFGLLTVIEQAEDQISPSGRHHKMWVCKCDCGKIKTINGDNLRGGNTISCGCVQKEITRVHRYKHGDADSRLYNIWCAMKRRCYNENDPKYNLYGGRGISICDEWRSNYASFMNWAYENGYDINAPRGKFTIDRIDVNGNYEPTNCRWVDQKVQANNIRTNHRITYNNETHTIAEWSTILDIPYSNLYSALSKNEFDMAKVLAA